MQITFQFAKVFFPCRNAIKAKLSALFLQESYRKCTTTDTGVALGKKKKKILALLFPDQSIGFLACKLSFWSKRAQHANPQIMQKGQQEKLRLLLGHLSHKTFSSPPLALEPLFPFKCINLDREARRVHFGLIFNAFLGVFFLIKSFVF